MKDRVFRFICYTLCLVVIPITISCAHIDTGEKPVSENVKSNLKFISENGSLVWIDDNVEFSTSDIARAQAHVPFTIIFPTYLPGTKQSIPVISGPLNCTSNNVMCNIEITYGVTPNGMIVISEWKTTSAMHEVLGREYVDIAGVQVQKDKNNTVFNFISGGLGFNVYTQNVPGDETLKVVESLIRQTK